MRKEIEAQGGLKLIYIDPPFDVGADFSLGLKIGEGSDEESFTKKPSVIEDIAYRDTWGKGADSFIAMIYERIKLMYDLLADDGSIYVHCDYRVSGYLRLVLDEVFGKDKLVNEIIWGYKSGGAGDTGYAKKHDTIFYYSKGDNFIFNNLKEKSYMGLGYSTGNKNVKLFDDNDGLGPYTLVNVKDWWSDIGMIATSKGRIYPTQKPDELLERIINISSNEGDIIADFFVGSGTTLDVAERLGRKWIGADLGKFGIHTTRKRMIDVQRELKKSGKDFRAFEILNVGKYERDNYVTTNDDLRAEERSKQAKRKEDAFTKLILTAYQAEPVTSFNTVVGKKRDRLVAVGPISTPVSSKQVHDIFSECKDKGITKVDILGFDYEMGLDFQEFVNQGVDVAFKIIPREVFDKKAVERGHVKFYDVAFIEVKPSVKGPQNNKELTIELADFSVFYNQDDSGEISEALRPGSSKVIVEDGQVVKITKDKESGGIEKEILTKKWSDWIDYWAIDFNFADRKEIITVFDGDEEKEVWTGDYIFDNEWQSFRTKKNRNLELTSAAREITKGKHKVAIKVVDIFGNDTTKVIEVEV